MTNLERLIRPFQSRDTTPSRRVPTSEPDKNENMVLSVGGKGSVKTYQISYSISVTQYMQKQERERKRVHNLTRFRP